MHDNSYLQLYLLNRRLEALRADAGRTRLLRELRPARTAALRARLATALHALAARLEPTAPPHAATDADLPLR